MDLAVLRQRATYLRYLFRYCVEARCRTMLEPRVWRASLDERLIDYETGVDLDGYDVHEVRIAMNAHAGVLRPGGDRGR